MYGKIKNIEMLPDRIHTEYSRLFAYVDYEKAEDAEAAVDHMDGGLLDKNNECIIIFVEENIDIGFFLQGMIDKLEISVKAVIEAKTKKKRQS